MSLIITYECMNYLLGISYLMGIVYSEQLQINWREIRKNIIIIVNNAYSIWKFILMNLANLLVKITKFILTSLPYLLLEVEMLRFKL